VKLRLPSPSFIVAAVALSLAMGGVGYAAGSLPKNSVGTKQLKNLAVTSAKIKPGAVTSDKIPDGGLTGADLAPGSLNGAHLAPNSLGGTQIDESSLALPSKPGSILLTGYDFHARGSVDYDTNGDGGIWTTVDSGAFAAPIEIPAGATVTGLKVFVVDNGPGNIDNYVGRFVPSTGDSTYTSGVTSTGTASFVRTVSLTPLPVIAGSMQELIIFLPVGAEYKLYGAQIDYQ
jgi:hypothetical protein